MEQSLNYYRAFYAVASAGNISHAADQLYISQPAISKSIRKLEESMDTKLFYRTSKGVALTQEGELLFTHVKKALEELQQGEEQLRMFREFGMGQLRIGASSTLCKYVLLPHLDRYLKNHPHVQVTINCQSSVKTLEMLEQGQIDAGLVGIDEPLRHVHFQSMGNIQDILVASPGYLNNLRLLGYSTLEEILFNGTFMLLDKKNLSRRYVDTYLTEHKVIPHHTLEVTTMDLLIEFAKVGLGIACVIREFVEKELENKELVEVPAKLSIPQREIGYVYPKEMLSKAVLNFQRECTLP